MTARNEHEFDGVVIGGGPAGATLAGLLAAGGRRVALYERERFPRDKLCGEFLSGEARASLARLGIGDALVADAAPIERARFTVPGGGQLEVTLPGSGHGLRRRTLDARLFARARELGARTHDGVEVQDVVNVGNGRPRYRVELMDAGQLRTVHAAWVVGAHGRRSALDGRLGRKAAAGPPPWVAFQQHHVIRGAPADSLDGVVEVHGFPDGYCGINRVDGDRVNVCALVDGPRLRAASVRRWPAVAEWLATQNAALARRLAELEPVDDNARVVAGTAHGRTVAERSALLFLGDAAGMIAPLCGDGQAMALRGAVLLADLILAAPAQLDAGAHARLRDDWTRVWQREFRTRLLIGRTLEWLLLGRHTQRWTVASLARLPAITRTLVRATRGEIR